MRAVPPKVLREIREGLQNIINGFGGEKNQPRMVRWISAIDAALKPKRSLAPARKRRTQKRQTRKEEWAEIRAAVLKRSLGGCERCGRVGVPLDCDHMFGGNGRRRTLQSVFTCWALCFGCHRQKTENCPDAAYWLQAFVDHCNTQTSHASGCGGPLGEGYLHAKEIAQRRLDSITTMKGISK